MNILFSLGFEVDFFVTVHTSFSFVFTGPWVQPSSAIMELTLENVKTKDQGSHLEQILLLSLYHGQILQSNYYFLPYGNLQLPYKFMSSLHFSPYV